MSTPAPVDLPAQVENGSDSQNRGTHRRARVAFAAAATVMGLVIAAWLIAAYNPALEPVGLNWQSPTFVQSVGVSEEGEGVPEWTAWDTRDGAAVSVVVRNPRLYPVTVSVPNTHGKWPVEIAPFDPSEGPTELDPDRFAPVDSVYLLPERHVVVALRVSDRCFAMEAGSAIGRDHATVDVTTFGVTEQFDVAFPATYMAGTTRGHGADPACQAG